jgi:hypothetical protein
MQIQVGDILLVQDAWCPEIPIAYTVTHLIPVGHGNRTQYQYVVNANRPTVCFEEVIFCIREGVIVCHNPVPELWQINLWNSH